MWNKWCRHVLEGGMEYPELLRGVLPPPPDGLAAALVVGRPRPLGDVRVPRGVVRVPPGERALGEGRLLRPPPPPPPPRELLPPPPPPPPPGGAETTVLRKPGLAFMKASNTGFLCELGQLFLVQGPVL